MQLHQTGPLLTLRVEDDGCGFAAAPDGLLPKTDGAGLRSIGVRVQMLQARLFRHSAPGQGTRMVVELPVPE